MKKFLMPLLLLGLLVGCAKNPTNPTSNQDQTSILTSLMGQNLRIEKIVLSKRELRAKGAEEGASINFERNKFYGSAGCNRFFGNYESDGENLQIDGAAATQMLCQPKELMDFESALLTHFRGDFKLSREGDRILLKSEEMTIYLSEI